MGQHAQPTKLKHFRGLEYTLCDLAVKCPDAFVPLFYHGFTPRHFLGFERAVAGDACKDDWRPVLPHLSRANRPPQLVAGKGAIAPQINGVLRHFEMQP